MVSLIKAIRRIVYIVYRIIDSFIVYGSRLCCALVSLL